MLAIRHFEKLSNTEAALVLDVSEPAAGMRYLRALRRLKKQLRQHADLFGDEFEFESLRNRGDAVDER